MTGHSVVPMEWNATAPECTHPYLRPVILSWLREGGIARVLDLGCGNGVLTGELARAGFEMTGIDASESGIRLASRHAPEARFLHATLDDPLPDALHRTFDAVLAAEVIEHLYVPRVLCARAREALVHGGRLIITTPYHGYLKNVALALSGAFDRHWHPNWDGGHVKFFSRATLTALLEAEGFRVRRFARVGRVPFLAKSMIVEAQQIS